MTAKRPAAAAPTVRKVFIVDDHPIVRQGLVKLLSDEKDLRVCGEAENARDGLQAIQRLQPDLVIVDISLPGKSGLELIRDLRAQHPSVPVLVLSMHEEQIYAERALRAGARGYVMKQAGGKVMVQAIRQVLSGQVYVSEKISARILDHLSEGRARPARSGVEKLTPREFEVFHLIGQGRATRQIADQLHVSVKTIEVHRLHIKQKLGVNDASALIRYAISWEQTEAAA